MFLSGFTDHGLYRFTTPYRSYELGKGKTVNYSGNHKRSIHLSVRDSLKKLQTEYIDLLYLHWWVSI
jgi:aryl-alcohol dehydrogenase-like predicted oxidoreductase